MRDIQLFRRYELIFFVATAVIYVSRRLIAEIDRINGMVETAQSNGVPASTVWRSLERYNHTLNNNIPLIVSICFMLLAWYVFHTLAFPLISDLIDDKKGWLYAGLSCLLILGSVFCYHYLKLYVRFREDGSQGIIGLHVFSLYRKRTVLADPIGFAILIGTYEVAFQCYQYLARKIAQESERHFRIVSFFLGAGISIGVFSFALNGYLPPTLWQYGLRDVLLILGLGIQILLLQAYVFTFILPLIQAHRTSEVILFTSIVSFLLMGLFMTISLMGASSNFYFRYSVPIMPLTSIAWIAAIAIAWGRKLLTKENNELQTQVSATSAELSSLRAQINPHFLFNALNSLYATALKENSEKTADGIQKLGDMMRFMLQENNHDRIPLDKEIEYLRNYIQIQRMRLDETQGIEIRVTIQEPNRPVSIAPMMLTPFVENAFKHGISLRHPSWIYITLTLDNTRLYVKVHNSRQPKQPETSDRHDPEEGQSGVGLENVRKRLELIYPRKHQLDIQQSEQDYFVSLTLVYI